MTATVENCESRYSAHWIGAFMFGLGVLIACAGCNQHRYQPAQWRAAPRSETTMPDTLVAAGGGSVGGRRVTNWLDPNTTLPGRLASRGYGTTLPGGGTTLPRGVWTTLPSRWTTLPNRGVGGTTLPNRNWDPTPNRWGTTLPGQSADNLTTLPESRWSRESFRGTTLPSDRNPLRD